MSNTFADTIRQLRINKGLSQLQLADEMYVTHSTISRWEAGSRLPDAMMISRLAKCLETSTEFLFSLISEEKETPNIIMVDDERFPLREGETPEIKSVRFRTLGCYPLTGGIESTATTLDEIIDETLSAVSSERTSRVIDNEAAGSMERRKREGYF